MTDQAQLAIPYTIEDAELAILRQAEEILLRRHNSTTGRDCVSEPAAAGRILQLRLAHREHEVFAALFLDSRHRIIAAEDLFTGTIDGAEVHPREVVKRALQHNAAAIIVGHNHPSESAEPSAADRAVTARLKQALALVDVRLLDHFVVTCGTPVSMAARGWV